MQQKTDERKGDFCCMREIVRVIKSIMYFLDFRSTP